MRPVVTIYSREGCHLCDVAREVVERVALRTPLEIQVVDIDLDPELRREYDTEVPVVEVDGREVSRFRITEEMLARALAGS